MTRRNFIKTATWATVAGPTLLHGFEIQAKHRPLWGRELNELYQVDRSIFTPKELKDNGLIWTVTPNFVTDMKGHIYTKGMTGEEMLDLGAYPMVSRTRKLRARYHFDWPKEHRQLAKEWMIKELHNDGWIFVYSVTITPFADDMDYSNMSYDPGVLVRGCKQKTEKEFKEMMAYYGRVV